MPPQQPYTEHFVALSLDEDDQDDSLAALAVEQPEAKPTDVDRWELVLTPQEYLLRFEDTLASVQLVNRAPIRKPHTTFHRGPDFSRWLLLAQANHSIWVDTSYKAAFFHALNDYQTAQPGLLVSQASLGSAHVPTAGFIHCLQEAGCDTVRIKEYGQKMPLVDQFLSGEPAQEDHRWAEHNEWDISTSFKSPLIWLFASAMGRTHRVEHYPIMVPGSKDFGNLRITHQVASTRSRSTRSSSTSSSPSTAGFKVQSHVRCLAYAPSPPLPWP